MATETPNSLFPEFPPVSTGEWERKIREDLCGADYDKKLVYQTIEGIPVRPYYRAEHLPEAAYSDSVPGAFPYLRGGTVSGNSWQIRQDIDAADPAATLQKAFEILDKGANSVGFRFDPDASPVFIREFVTALNGSRLAEKHEIHFLAGQKCTGILPVFLEKSGKQAMATFDYDPLGELTLTGSFPGEPAMEEAVSMIRQVEDPLPIRLVQVRGSIFHNAGASAVQELGFSLAAGNEYLACFTDAGIEAGRAARALHFGFAIGANYFMEIARLRAARLLWTVIVNAHKPSGNEDCRMHIHATSSSWNRTLYDPYVNMLRSATEAMAAAIGGVNSLSVTPFDAHFRKPGAFSERLARNQQIILKEEACLDRVADPAAGSYYIESLTQSIASAAWDLFREVEALGGYSAAFARGFVQERIESTAQEREQNIILRKDSLIGTNQYPDLNERMSDKTDRDLFSGPSGSEGRPLSLYRGARAFEQLRLRTEKHGTPPSVFLFTYGNMAMRRARAAFATNFFGCAGFRIADNPGFPSIDEGIAAAQKARPDIVVICSSDEEYPAIAPTIMTKLGDYSLVVVAGYPKDSLEELKQAGIRHFIHLRSNIIESLTAFQEALGIHPVMPDEK